MKGLSKREKTLLYILLCMIVFIGGIFLLVLPSFSSLASAKSTNKVVEQQLTSTKNNMPDYSDVDKKLEEVTASIKKTKKEFYSEMVKEDVDQIITTFAVEHNLVPVTLSITDAADEEIMSYSDYVAIQNSENGSASTSTPSSTVKAKVFNVSLLVQGNVTNVQQLVNDANETYSMKVASVQYSNQEEEEKQMTITFKIFMIS